MTLDIPWIAITGSNGKTTTREMLSHILRRNGPVACSARNYNNNIGVPLSILSADAGTWAGVIELGTNAPGEIAALAEILRPAAAIVTSVGSTHLAGLGDVEGVAREKSEVFSALPESGLAVYGRETNYPHILAGKAAHCNQRIFSSEGGEADIFAEEIESGEDRIAFRAWSTPFGIPVAGRHNVNNALAAIAVADWLGVTPADASERLKTFCPVAGRLEVRRIGRLRLVDDTYNANPDSLCAAARYLADVEAERRVVICGAMAELGDAAERLHRESGYMLARSGIDLLLAVGKQTVSLAEAASMGAVRCKVHYFPSIGAVLPKLKKLIEPDDLVLVKGSRRARMERVVTRLERIFSSKKEARA